MERKKLETRQRMNECLVCEQRRNTGQNAVMWPILQAWAKQKQWSVNGSMCYLTAEEWKDVLTAAFEGETSPRIASGLDGGIVMLGRRTSRYGKKRFSEWLDWLHAASHPGAPRPQRSSRR